MTIGPENLPDLPVTILVIGDLSSGSEAYKKQPEIEGLCYAGFLELNKAALQTHQPDLIVSALAGRTFDVMDMARRLVELSFKGRYRACTQWVPRPDIICAEVARAAPTLDFDVLSLSQISAYEYGRRRFALVA